MLSITKGRDVGLAILAFNIFISNVTFAARPINLSKEVLPITNVRHFNANDLPTLQVLKQRQDINGTQHIRVQQVYKNIPVWGSHAVIHVPKNKMLFKINAFNDSTLINLFKRSDIKKNGFYFADLEKDLATLPTQIETKNDAIILRLKNTFTQSNNSVSWQIMDDKASPIIYINKQNKARLSYLVSFSATANGKTPKQPTAIIDAQTYEIYKQWNNIKTFKPQRDKVTAIGYGGNQLLGQWQYGKEKSSLPIERLADDDKCYLSNKDVAVYKRSDFEIYRPAKVISFNCQKDKEDQTEFLLPERGLFGHYNGAFSPYNDALYYGIVIKNLYQDWYNISVLMSADMEKPKRLRMNILYLDYENAFWDSRAQQMFFGLGGLSLYPLVTLGIAAHEVSHGFTDQHSDLAYNDESGALNESFSDMIIPVISYYESNGKEVEWSTGKEVLKSNLDKDKADWEAVRYFDQPTKDGYSIDHVKDYKKLQEFCAKNSRRNEEVYQSCIVHLASGVFNKVFYELANASGWDLKSAFGVMVKANQDYWTSTETFQTAACGVKNAAEDMQKTNKNLPLDSIDKSFESVGISLKDC